MKTKAPGAILVEVIVASGILAFGLTLVYLAFLDATRISQRNELSSNAINYLANQMDIDRSAGTATIGSASSPFLVNGQSRPAMLARNLKSGPCGSTGGCTVEYILTWTGPAGDQTLRADSYILPATAGGL